MKCEIQILHERKGNLSRFLGIVLHVNFGQEEESWVLEKSSMHVVAMREFLEAFFWDGKRELGAIKSISSIVY